MCGLAQNVGGTAEPRGRRSAEPAERRVLPAGRFTPFWRYPCQPKHRHFPGAPSTGASSPGAAASAHLPQLHPPERSSSSSSHLWDLQTPMLSSCSQPRHPKIAANPLPEHPLSVSAFPVCSINCLAFKSERGGLQHSSRSHFVCGCCFL